MGNDSPDRIDRALAQHVDAARELGLCPRLHQLDERGVCPDCTVELEPVTLDDDEPPGVAALA